MYVVFLMKMFNADNNPVLEVKDMVMYVKPVLILM